MFSFPVSALSGSRGHRAEMDAGSQFTLTPEMVINNLGLKQNLSTTFMFSLGKSMEKYPNLELCNIVLRDVNCSAIKIHLSQVKTCFFTTGLLGTFDMDAGYLLAQ